jgi:hypothetical protein
LIFKRLGWDRLSAEYYFKNHKKIIESPVDSPIHKP